MELQNGAENVTLEKTEGTLDTTNVESNEEKVDKLAVNNDLKAKIKNELGSIIWTTSAVAQKNQKKQEKQKNKKDLKNQVKRTPNNKNWAANLPEEKKCKENDVWYFIPCNKTGIFRSYGKKEGIIWLEMHKKNSFEFMSRQWSLKLDECELVERDGVIVNPDKFYKDSIGYHVKENANEAAVD